MAILIVAAFPSRLSRYNARRWLDELLIDPAQTIELLAMREHKSERSIRCRSRSSPPFLAEAALEGRLTRGFRVKRLTDLPVLWSEQWRAVGTARANFRFEPKSADPRCFIPFPNDQNAWAHFRWPMDMTRQGWARSLFQASQQWSRMSS